MGVCSHIPWDILKYSTWKDFATSRSVSKWTFNALLTTSFSSELIWGTEQNLFFELQLILIYCAVTNFHFKFNIKHRHIRYLFSINCTLTRDVHFNTQFIKNNSINLQKSDFYGIYTFNVMSLKLNYSVLQNKPFYANSLNVTLGSIIQLILKVPVYFHTSGITQVKFCHETLT
jgi:hypothetical protein